MRSIIVALVFLIALGGAELGAAPALEPVPAALLDQLEQCLRKIELRYSQDSDYEFDLQSDCHALAGLWVQANRTGLIQPPLEKNPTFEQLRDLHSIASTVHARAQAAHYPFDISALPGLLKDTLVLESEPDLSWWKQFTDWLANLFERNPSQRPDWLKNWLSKLAIPAWLAEVFYKGLALVLAVMLLAIIAVEVRAAGVSNWFKRHARRALHRGEIHESPDAQLTWDTIGRLPAREKILAGYNKLLYTLASKQLIPSDSSLTNQELQTRLEKALGAEQPMFRRLVHGVEATLYGGTPLDNATADELLRGAAQLAGASPERPSAQHCGR